MEERVRQALIQFNRNRRALLRAAGTPAERMFEDAVVTGDPAVFEGVDATPEELVARSLAEARHAAADKDMVRRWAIAGLGTEMTMHETNSLGSTLRWALSSAAEKYPDDVSIRNAIESARQLSENLSFLSRFNVAGYQGVTRVRDIEAAIRHEFASAVARGYMELEITDAFRASEYYVNGNATPAAMNNLVRNALYWGSRDNKKAKVRLDAYTVVVPPKDPEGDEYDRMSTSYWVLVVEDNGPGVAPELRDRIFEPGVSGRRSTGIGLHLCRAVLESRMETVVLDDRPSDLGGARFLVGWKSKLRPAPAPDRSVVLELAVSAHGMADMLRNGHGPDVLAMTDVYGEIQREALRIRLEGPRDADDTYLLEGAEAAAVALAEYAPAPGPRPTRVP